ncbi:MAG: NADPH-dependent assimilatory sulfite reductase hemoprotein subunit, partial [Gammaproteobacteria bacterium]|nr:NADPH-dependent assimilatory sulfite reductase hemoprotein subunit [Gammaproteobacteria bacterium]
MDTTQKLSGNELIKSKSRYLRGTLEQSLVNEISGGLADDDTHIIKFHGFYQQDDRDVRLQRRELLLEPYYSFMLRARLPGGVCTPEQWLAIDEAGCLLGNGTLRLTTRQTFQYHGILKRNLKEVVRRINAVMIDSIGGCGDVNRNILCNANPLVSELHSQTAIWAKRISEHLLPKTRAYHEIWLDGKKVDSSEGGEVGAVGAGTDTNKDLEPIYGATYLPRKFKTAVAIPPYNDVDIYSNDLGFIAIADGDQLLGFNVLAGGGMGTTHGDKTTFPRLADVLGFVEAQHVLAVAEAVITTQRDFGNRVERKHARLKYTVETMGVTAFRDEVQKRAGIQFEAARPVNFINHGDRLGWVEGADGRWHLTLFIENGRLADGPSGTHLSGLRRIAQVHQGEFRITASQNLVIANVAASDKRRIEEIAQHNGLLGDHLSAIRKNSMACVALPTCPQAMSEAERYFPELITKVENIAKQYALDD